MISFCSSTAAAAAPVPPLALWAGTAAAAAAGNSSSSLLKVGDGAMRQPPVARLQQARWFAGVYALGTLFRVPTGARSGGSLLEGP